uniref:Divergent polysaccharide deacetylase n=1 Tax=Candidatus Kentrum sp. DK TaxID=2126562 RepID=A0A450S153_9GAMM|nr:MAG: hypothetical protein BECKDK2373B_GA0170837_101059 [Candidatus Kentron sp. DK]
MLLCFALHPGAVLAGTVLTFPQPEQDDSSPAMGAASPQEKTEKKIGDVSASPNQKPLISIIVDDLGYLRKAGFRALDLPGHVSFSFIPKAPHARELVDAAHARGKEILLHIPMESNDNRDLGKSGLTKKMTQTELTQSVCTSIQSMPHARGLSNHMGSLLTTRKTSMQWLMGAIRTCGPKDGRNLYFLDSHTTGGTVAAATAREYGIPTLERDVFLDHKPTADFIRGQLHELVRKAKKKGTALGIAHPYPETLKVLGRTLPGLKERGVRLVPVSMLLTRQTQRRQKSRSNAAHSGDNPPNGTRGDTMEPMPQAEPRHTRETE